MVTRCLRGVRECIELEYLASEDREMKRHFLLLIVCVVGVLCNRAVAQQEDHGDEGASCLIPSSCASIMLVHDRSADFPFSFVLQCDGHGIVHYYETMAHAVTVTECDRSERFVYYQEEETSRTWAIRRKSKVTINGCPTHDVYLEQNSTPLGPNWKKVGRGLRYGGD